MTTFNADLQASVSSGSDEVISPTSYLEIIETVISSLQEDQSAMVNHSEQGHLWKFKYGTVEVFVQITGETDEDTLTVWSTVLKLPAKNEAQLTRKLLELNWSSTFEARFSIVDDQVVVSASRTVAELSPGEVSRNITLVASLADEFDEPLQAEYS